MLWRYEEMEDAGEKTEKAAMPSRRNLQFLPTEDVQVDWEVTAWHAEIKHLEDSNVCDVPI